MTTNYLEMKDLVGKMEGKPTTHGWDIVCSYDVRQLNVFLKSQYEAGRLAREVMLKTEREHPIDGKKYTIQYDIKFASPVISFIAGRSGFATLTMPIDEGSTVWIINEEAVTRTIPIPGGTYSVQAIVPLVAIKGDTGEVIEHDDVVTFSDGNSHDNHIIVHFNSERGTLYQIVPPPYPKDHDILITYFLPVLKDYFQTNIQGIDYALSSINNKQPASGKTILTPKSFVFTSTGDKNDGVLSLYIQTKESGCPPGNPSPSFQPGDKAVHPIPKGYTASIILSNKLVTQSFLMPQLKASGFSVELSNPISGGGIFAVLRKNQNIISVGKSGESFFESHSYDGLQISMHDNPINMTLQKGGITLKFEGNALSKWSQHSKFSESYSPHGSVNIKIWLHKGPVPLTLSAEDVIGLHISVDPYEFTVDLQGEPCYIIDFGCTDTYPRFYEYLKGQLQFPAIDLHLPGLDFFNTTNLLAPGQNVIGLDTSKGVQTPHDFLVVGNVTNLKQLRELRTEAADGFNRTT
ncbi:hypothetical protein [Paenibacillus sp. FSL H8-0537]|uniref:hypothetical protein n=1 Tax=Paenibacillus sp. FSL H8-0537 TaxID=2921399 RepID=UPI00310166E9